MASAYVGGNSNNYWWYNHILTYKIHCLWLMNISGESECIYVQNFVLYILVIIIVSDMMKVNRDWEHTPLCVWPRKGIVCSLRENLALHCLPMEVKVLHWTACSSDVPNREWICQHCHITFDFSWCCWFRVYLKVSDKFAIFMIIEQVVLIWMFDMWS